MSDCDWVQKQLVRRASGETLRHAVPCKDSEGYKGWLAVSDQRIWYFQKGPAGDSEEYGFDAERHRRDVPFSFGKRVLLEIAGEPFAMPTEVADELESAVRAARDQGTADT